MSQPAGSRHERRTKIVATVGPASDEPSMIRRLIEAGLDMARVNLSHGSVDEAIGRIGRVRAAAREARETVGVLVDLPGPKIRTAPFPEEGAHLEVGDPVRLVAARPGDRSDRTTVGVELEEGLERLAPGDRVALGDGVIVLKVIPGRDGIEAVVESGGIARGRPGVSLPSGRIRLRSPTQDDLRLLGAVLEAGVDAVAVSFVQSAADVVAVREAAGPGCPMIVAKIETGPAVAAIGEILSVADAVMVARGDLGVRLPLEDVPHIQKRIIATGVSHGKPVITATQMLESMVAAPTPTRAEVTDVANAVFDGTSAVMLSGETAIGAHPVAAVAAMARITRRAEREFDYEGWGRRLGREQLAGLHEATVGTRITAAITGAAWRAYRDADLSALIACTRSGRTARMISRFRPTCPILAMTSHERTAAELSVAWGIRPVLMPRYASTDENVWHAVEKAAHLGIVRAGDLVGVLVGSPSDDEPTTDILRIVRIR